MAEDVPEVSSAVAPSGEYISRFSGSSQLISILAAAWKELCPIYDSLSPDQL